MSKVLRPVTNAYGLVQVCTQGTNRPRIYGNIEGAAYPHRRATKSSASRACRLGIGRRILPPTARIRLKLGTQLGHCLLQRVEALHKLGRRVARR